MPDPMWDPNRKTTQLRINRAVTAYNTAKQHIGIPEALRFAGYVASHRPNPSGRSWTVPDEFGGGLGGTILRWAPATDQERADRYWKAVSTSGHRYAKGIHGANYEMAGRRLIGGALRNKIRESDKFNNHSSTTEALLKAFEQGQDQAHIPLLDHLQEHYPEAHEILARPETPENPGRMCRMNRVQARRFALIPHTTPARNLVSTSPREAQWMKPVGKSPDRRWELDPANKKLFNPLQGSRLAVVLHEIRDKYGEHDPHLRQLAQQALSGAGDIGGKGDVYTQIRDRLHLHAAGKAGPLELGQRGPMTAHAKRADEIARSYNWHRVGAGLQVDEAVADYINKVAKDHLKDRNEQMRATHNVFGLGSKERGQASPESRMAFLKGLQQHVRKQAVGPNSIYGLSNDDISSEKLMKSIRRLAQNEEHIHGVKGVGGIRQATPSAPVSEVKPEAPAWYPRTAGKPGISRVNPRARAGQFMRLRKMNRYSESDFSLPQEMNTEMSQQHGPEMLARGDTNPGHGLKKPDARTQQLAPTNASPVSDRALAAISRPGKRENYEPTVMGRPQAVKKAQQLTLLSSAHLKAGLELDDMGHEQAKRRAYAEAYKHRAEANKLIDQHKITTSEIYGGDVWQQKNQMIKDAIKKHLEASIPSGWSSVGTSTEEEPIKKDAYRAPAGGIAVRGTAYKGGSLIPDMKGKFMTMARARRALKKS